MGLKSMAMYWVRVVATNEGGDSEPQELDNYIIAMPPPGKYLKLLIFYFFKLAFSSFSSFFIFFTVRPEFTDKNINNFMVMKAGSAARLTFNFKVLNKNKQNNDAI